MTGTADTVDSAARGAGALWGWALRETGAMLPAALARLGVTGRARLITLDRQGEAGPAEGARRSVFAHWRHGGRAAGRTVAILSPGAVLRRELVLPAAAAGDVRQAVRLRLESLCPIPPADAAFAAAPVGPASDGLRVALAFVRRSDLEAAVKTASARGGDWAVAADFTEAGARLIFAEGRPAGRPSRWLMAALAAAGLAAAYTAADMRLSAETLAYAEARDDLLTRARALQRREGGEAAARAAAYPHLDAVLAAVSNADLPEGARVEQVRLNQRTGAVVLEGGEVRALDLTEPGS